MLTRTGRRRFPVLLAVIAALAMAMLFSPVQAQEGSAPDKPTPAATQSKSEYVDAHNAGVHDLAELTDGADPLDPDAGDTEEEEERKAGKQGQVVGTQQGRSNHTVDICDRTPEVEAGLLAYLRRAPLAMRSEVELWLAPAVGKAQCVDQLIGFLRTLAPEDQARMGLPWVATLVLASPGQIAKGSFMLAEWLIETRSAAIETDLSASWQQIVDTLVVEGVARLAPYSE